MSDLEPSLRSALIIRASSTSGSVLGGMGCVPGGWTWPTAENGRSLSALAQFLLSQEHANSIGLPRPGMLTIFYDSVGAPWTGLQDAVRVELFDETATNSVAVPDDCDRFDEVAVDLSRTEFPRLGRPTPSNLAAFRAVQQAFDPRQSPLSFLGGHAFPLQEPMEDACTELVPGVPPADWRLLLQLDTDPRPGFAWGSGSGRLYIWVPLSDLRQAAFDRAVAIVQDT